MDEAAQISPDFSWCAEATQGRPLIAKRIIPITTAEYPLPASRPRYSVLSNSSLNQTFGIESAGWRTQLRLVFGLERSLQLRSPHA
jgi:dTDP-4-dehydrorhamnose reductase